MFGSDRALLRSATRCSSVAEKRPILPYACSPTETEKPHCSKRALARLIHCASMALAGDIIRICLIGLQRYKKKCTYANIVHENGLIFKIFVLKLRKTKFLSKIYQFICIVRKNIVPLQRNLFSAYFRLSTLDRFGIC